MYTRARVWKSAPRVWQQKRGDRTLQAINQEQFAHAPRLYCVAAPVVFGGLLNSALSLALYLLLCCRAHKKNYCTLVRPPLALLLLSTTRVLYYTDDQSGRKKAGGRACTWGTAFWLERARVLFYLIKATSLRGGHAERGPVYTRAQGSTP